MALYLKRTGHSITIFERFEEAKPIGSELILHGRGGAGPGAAVPGLDGGRHGGRSVQANWAGGSALAGSFLRMTVERNDPFARRKAYRRSG